MNDDDDLGSDSSALDHTNAQWSSQAQQVYTTRTSISTIGRDNPNADPVNCRLIKSEIAS